LPFYCFDFMRSHINSLIVKDTINNLLRQFISTARMRNRGLGLRS
jgi:hypothetical protein